MANKYAKYEVTYATATNHCNRETFNTMVMYEVDWQAYRDAARNDYFAKADYVNRLIDSAEHVVGANYYIGPELNKAITDASLQCKEAYHQLIAAIKGR